MAETSDSPQAATVNVGPDADAVSHKAASPMDAASVDTPQEARLPDPHTREYHQALLEVWHSGSGFMRHPATGAAGSAEPGTAAADDLRRVGFMASDPCATAALVEEWPRHAAVDCVECLGCGFTFAAMHTDTDREGYTCPECGAQGD